MSDAPEPPGGGEIRAARDIAAEKAAPPGHRRFEQLIDGHGFAEYITLAGLAAQFQQFLALRLELDALGHRVETQRICQREDGSRQRGGIHTLAAVVIAHQPFDERAVDLEYVDGETM